MRLGYESVAFRKQRLIKRCKLPIRFDSQL